MKLKLEYKNKFDTQIKKSYKNKFSFTLIDKWCPVLDFLKIDKEDEYDASVILETVEHGKAETAKHRVQTAMKEMVDGDIGELKPTIIKKKR